ncbi:TM0106 family RecB-like putative nuclease [Pseudarthrobacter phenanthrenivorans]|uniref:TM0106 family RecB-like putative nuclease n=1 Tax=Pseudarthrobacter phenanthrenivorans TaxID=361575 RepID=UPI001128DD02|nr:TM0106 family RecB-like putative nuclease [Pseudarthrobacter phenanthrenivorans]TPV49370.1 TM0106 family RecB-like putative nuclease [Pseudarthrobacter phenanthrenivorans]
MFLLEAAVAGAPQDLVFSASDLVAASECEYRTLRILDEKLGRSPKAEFPADEMQVRAGELGDRHEQTVLASLIGKYGEWDASRGGGVYSLERGQNLRADLQAKHAETELALRSGADVVFQATFFDGEFLGYADFLVNEAAGTGEPGRYEVWDTKLARHAKVGALLQLAAYGDQLLGMGLEPSPVVTLVLGTRVGEDWLRSSHSLPDLLPVFRERRRRFRQLTAQHRETDGAVQWQQPGTVHCGRCDYCAEQVQLHRDLLMVAGMSVVQRKKLRAAGITTIEELAAMPAEDARNSVVRLRAQARMQLGLEAPAGSRTFTKDGKPHTVSFTVLPGNTIGLLPPPSPGDIFFDFEGDPLWQDPATGAWGIEYLFGVVEAPVPGAAGEPVFRPFWAHSRTQERRAFLDFLEYVEERRSRFPDMHVYHYAAYEKTALRNLSLAHQTGEETVDSWLRQGLLVDLYATVRHSLRISEASYSIKKLEPLYMGNNLRSGDVKDAGASVVAYAAYCAARDAGNAAEADRILASISDYNHYDCLSTLRLRDWLLAVAPQAGMTAAPDAPSTLPAAEPSAAALPSESPSATEETPAETRLREYLAGIPDSRPWTNDERAIAMVAAATGYHRRERKQFWWQHFDRVEAPIENWADQRNVFVVSSAEVTSDWALAKPRERMRTRVLRLRGTMAEGSDFRPDSSWCRLYDAPPPDGMAAPDAAPGARAYSFGTRISELAPAPDNPEHTIITIAERESGKVAAYPHLPVALTEDQPLATASIEAALADIAQMVGSTLPSLPAHPGLDILRKQPPRFRTLAGPVDVRQADEGSVDYASAITASLRDLDHSYLAVQGPPGTGKTHVGAHVIGRLVAEGWKIGVVGQSHNVVENLLCCAIAAGGVPPTVVAKKLNAPHEVPWALHAEGDVAQLLASPGGCLVGGTAWTMTGKEVPAGSLDLLVIDEAGQFSLANTLAVSRAAKRLLLLGDPQQLPQVTQGAHPEPVDDSALGWLAAGHATLPASLGYFLADSWRMHPDLCRAVSRLSYEGKLQSAPAASLRKLEGLPPGVETVLVEHAGNATASAEEAAEVVRQVRRHLGLKWTPGAESEVRPLDQEDVLVVAAYNAQVHLVRKALEEAGLAKVRVGTVDKFQGQEAPVVIVSMACSAVAEAPRGAEFLLNRNRINVAVSRGQWRAVIIRSPELTSYMPHKPAALEELGAFLGLSPRE